MGSIGLTLPKDRIKRKAVFVFLRDKGKTLLSIIDTSHITIPFCFTCAYKLHNCQLVTAIKNTEIVNLISVKGGSILSPPLSVKPHTQHTPLRTTQLFLLLGKRQFPDNSLIGIPVLFIKLTVQLSCFSFTRMKIK